MSIRAIIFDIYGTILEVGIPPHDAEMRWQCLCREILHIEPPISYRNFSIESNKEISRLHVIANAKGILWPEVQWPSVVVEIIPAVAQLSNEQQKEFFFRQIQILHTIRMSSETADLLRWLKEREYLLGIASNAQAYTLRELQESLACQGLGMDLFKRELCFWSFEHGFSKPDPHVFQILTARLAIQGICPAEILMVGDRLDNDITPAKVHGWQTWHVSKQEDKNWNGLREYIKKSESEVLT